MSSNYNNSNSNNNESKKKSIKNISDLLTWTPEEIKGLKPKTIRAWEEKTEKTFDWRDNPRHKVSQLLNGILFQSIKDNNIPLAKKLLTNTDLYFQDDEGNTALHIAVAHHNTELVDFLLNDERFEEEGVDLHIKNKDGFRALTIAINNGYEDIVKLIKAKSKINNESNILGQGAFGIILYPALPNINNNGNRIDFPNNITKIGMSSDRFNPTNIKYKQKMLENRIGYNEDHRINLYKTEYTGDNISSTLRNNLNIYGSKGEKKLPMVRMPYLGINFSEIKNGNNLNTIRNVPIINIIKQFVKLMTHVYKLWNITEDEIISKGYENTSLSELSIIHGDIRPFNIMILPKNGTMTIIDFDYLDFIDNFYDQYEDNFGYYSNPPEFLSLQIKEATKPMTAENEQKARNNAKRMMRNYKSRTPENNENTIKYLIHKYGTDQYSSFTALKKIYKTEVILENAIIEAIKTNDIYLNRHPEEAESRTILKTFDSFGLANTLLVFVDDVYPGIIGSGPISNTDFYEKMKPLFPDYTPKHLKACTDAILEITYKILLPMSDFLIEKRMAIEEGLNKIRAIQQSLEYALEANENKEEQMGALRGLEAMFSNSGRKGFGAFGTGGRRTQKRKNKLRKSKQAKQTRRK